MRETAAPRAGDEGGQAGERPRLREMAAARRAGGEEGQMSERPRLREMAAARRAGGEGGRQMDGFRDKDQMAARIKERVAANFDFDSMSGREVLDELMSRLGAEGDAGQRLMLVRAINRISDEYARLEKEVDLLFEALTEAEEKLRLFLDKD